MIVRFFFTENYKKILETIEDFILESSGKIEEVSAFWDEHDRVLNFIQHNPKTPAIHPVTGDQSWVLGEWRYRLFFRAIEKGLELHVYFTHIIDNRQANLNLFPNHKLPTYEEE